MASPVAETSLHVDVPDDDTAALNVFQILPRGMYFGFSRATSIDLCVRDLVGASRYSEATTIFAEDIDDCFPAFALAPLPKPSRATTYRRANHVARVAKVDPPDIIVVQQHLPTAAAIARRLPGCKVVLQTHNFQKPSGENGGLLERARHALRRHQYNCLAGVVHVSNACAQSFAHSWGDVSVPNCIVNNGLDFSIWRPSSIRTQEMICVGRCAPEKGILEAAQAVAKTLPRFPGWRARFILSAIGTHPKYFAAVREIVAGLGGQADILVQRPFSEVKAVTERAAIAIIPSKWQEPFGRTALEAHAGGAAVITSGTGGLAEVSGDAAVTLTSVTAEAIADAVERLVLDEMLCARISRSGMAHVRAHFDIKVQATRLDDFCCAVTKRSTAASAVSERPRTTQSIELPSLFGPTQPHL